MDPNNSPAGVSGTPKRASRGACHECASAKVKCLRQNVTDDGKCERCHLRGKDCGKRTPLARKRRTQKGGRVMELEQRLDTIVNLLQNPQSHTSTASTPQSMTTTISPPSNPLDDLANLATAQAALPTQQMGPEVHTARQSPMDYETLKSQDAPALPFADITDLPPQHPDDEANLETFKTEMIWYFPSVVIPPATTAQMLRQEKPFLFRTIMLAVTHHQRGTQKEVWKEIVDYVSLHIFIRGERSLDLLQGLLVYTAWCNYSYFNNSQTGILSQLVISLATDLGLNREPQILNRTHNSLVDATSSSSWRSGKNKHTTDDKRSLLGCFYLSSLISVCLKKSEPLRFSAYIENCCQDLIETAEYSTDAYLVQMVRLQRCSMRITQLFSTEDIDASRSLNVPLGLYIHALSSELQSLRASLSVSLQTDRSKAYIMLHYYNASTHLYELVFHEPSNVTYPHGTPPLQRIEILHSCLTTARLLIDTFFLIPSSAYVRIPFMAYALVGYGLITLSRLCLLDSPDWDRSHARSVARLVETMDLFGERIDEAHALQVAKFGEKDNFQNAIFPTLSARVKKGRSFYMAKLAAEVTPDADRQTDMTGQDYITDPANMDESFWQDFVMDWGGDLFSSL